MYFESFWISQRLVEISKRVFVGLKSGLVMREVKILSLESLDEASVN
jgi:hypothetical protein